jgi:hypothetical protein
MHATILVAMIFIILLGLEWHFRLRTARVIAALLAMVVLFFAAPGYTRAARHALGMSRSERITEIRGNPVSDYVSGVRTMERAISEDANMGANARLIALAALLWLAVSPILRRAPRAPPTLE